MNYTKSTLIRKPVHFRMAGALRFLSVLLILLVSVSCRMKQDIYIEKDGSGTVRFDLSLAEYLTEVMEQLGELVQEPGENAVPDGDLFDLEGIRRDFAGRDHVTLTDLDSPDPYRLEGAIRFDHIEKALLQEGGTAADSSLFRFSRENGRSRLDVRIDLSTIGVLLEGNPSLNSPLMENFGPAANRGLSDEDFLEMMEFALGAESRQGILDSLFILNVEVEGTVVSQTGGRQVDDRTVAFEVPLLDLLVLKSPLHYSVEFR